MRPMSGVSARFRAPTLSSRNAVLLPEPPSRPFWADVEGSFLAAACHRTAVHLFVTAHRFTNSPSTLKITSCPPRGARIVICGPSLTPPVERTIMASSGELIRLMNYVDDISTTLRRIKVASVFIPPEERKRLSDYMRNSDPNYLKVLEALERGD